MIYFSLKNSPENSRPWTNHYNVILEKLEGSYNHQSISSFIQMQKLTKQQNPAQQPAITTLTRDQQFSFVAPSQKNNYATQPIDSELLQLSRNEPPVERNFEVTFQRAGEFAVNISNLKREERDNLRNTKEEELPPAEQIQNDHEAKQSGHPREEQMQKTEHSSSSGGKEEIEEKVIDYEESQAHMKVEPMKTTRLSYLIKKSDSHNDFIQLNCELPNVYQSQILLNKNDQDYAPDRANVCGMDSLQFSKFKIALMDIQKLKIYPQTVKKKSFRIKITHQKEVYNMGVELRRELYYLPEHYVWFAKIINSRLIRMGCKMPKESKNNILHTNGIFNQGVIYKCSKYRKKWEKRFILINNEGLFSYKNPKESYTVSIPADSMQELWTNFQMFGSHLIIKVKHKGDKTEFAIPVIDYCLKEDSQNWLFSFYRLLMEHKIHIKV